MTISPNRSAIFHGTDPVAGALRASLSVAITSQAERATETSSRCAAPLDLEALYPALFPPAQPATRGWWLRRLVPQH